MEVSCHGILVVSVLNVGGQDKVLEERARKQLVRNCAGFTEPIKYACIFKSCLQLDVVDFAIVGRVSVQLDKSFKVKDVYALKVRPLIS